MTIEERVEFLTQSIESHDRQIAELVENGAKTEALIVALAKNVAALVESTQINFDRLTRAMTGLVDHVADHARRIERLESQ